MKFTNCLLVGTALIALTATIGFTTLGQGQAPAQPATPGERAVGKAEEVEPVAGLVAGLQRRTFLRHQQR